MVITHDPTHLQPREELNPQAPPIAQPITVMDLLPPSPAEIDEAIEHYEAAQLLVKQGKASFDIIEQRLIFLVDQFGHVPANADRSKRLAGRHHLATITIGTTISVDEDAVETFYHFLDSVGLSILFDRFFAANTKHTLVDGARNVLKTLDIPKRVEEKIAALFGKAFDLKSKKPSVKTETTKPEKPVRTPRAGKAAA